MVHHVHRERPDKRSGNDSILGANIVVVIVSNVAGDDYVVLCRQLNFENFSGRFYRKWSQSASSTKNYSGSVTFISNSQVGIGKCKRFYF